MNAILSFDGEKLRRLREQANLSQNELAYKAGVRSGSSLVCRWENGTAAPNTANAIALARALGVKLEALYREAER